MSGAVWRARPRDVHGMCEALHWFTLREDIPFYNVVMDLFACTAKGELMYVSGRVDVRALEVEVQTQGAFVSETGEYFHTQKGVVRMRKERLGAIREAILTMLVKIDRTMCDKKLEFVQWGTASRVTRLHLLFPDGPPLF